jgi:dienelactone hydrolase
MFSAAQAPTIPSQGLAISGVMQSGRRPIPSDGVFTYLVDGLWQPPKEGDVIRFRGEDHPWKPIAAGKDGTFDDSKFEGGYLYLQMQSQTARPMLLHETGATLVYVNGSPRAGDPYGNGSLFLPVLLKPGLNELLLAGGRGPIHPELIDPPKPVSLQDSDTVLPDFTTEDRDPAWASVILRNATESVFKGALAIVKLPDGRGLTTSLAPVLPMSVRKIAFRIPSPKQPLKGPLKCALTVTRAGKPVHSETLTVNVQGPLDRRRVTFVSDVDGSVQYYAAVPAQVPSPKNALVLTLHGASVEATGQAAAYAPKDWATIVAATNRRPYGFDWEDIGRSDALEVLNDAKKRFPHDPARVDLTGHSMGGHGTWAVGTLYPNLFASIAPSAAWISFWSYAGGWNPRSSDLADEILRRSMDVSDTLGRDTNTLNEDVYILHGSADDNVPVTEARTMKRTLEDLHHPNLQYHEQPGAGHWWGNQCVDWPPIFDMIQKARLNPESADLDFTTQDPAVSAVLDWLTIQQQTRPMAASRVVGHRDAAHDQYTLKTTNVARLQVREIADSGSVTIDGQTISNLSAGYDDFVNVSGTWSLAANGLKGEKSPDRGGPFKQIFNHRLVLVVGTAGTKEETKWGWDRARFDSETLLYRGNGAIDVVADREYSAGRFRGRNVLLYGNAQTNSAWHSLLGACPLPIIAPGVAIAGHKILDGENGGVLVYPKPGEASTLVGAVTGTGVEAMRFTDRFGLFTSGVAYPDWLFCTLDGEIVTDGFFDNRWRVDPALSAGLTHGQR